MDDKKTPQSLFENLEIGYPFELAFIMYISLIFSLGIIIGAYVDGQLDWFVGILGGAYMLLSLCSVLGTHVWKIWVKGEKIIYRSYAGIKHYYTVYYIKNSPCRIKKNNLIRDLYGNIAKICH